MVVGRPPSGEAFAMCNVPQGDAMQMPQVKLSEAKLAISSRRQELEQLQGFVIQNNLL